MPPKLCAHNSGTKRINIPTHLQLVNEIYKFLEENSFLEEYYDLNENNKMKYPYYMFVEDCINETINSDKDEDPLERITLLLAPQVELICKDRLRFKQRILEMKKNYVERLKEKLTEKSEELIQAIDPNDTLGTNQMIERTLQILMKELKPDLDFESESCLEMESDSELESNFELNSNDKGVDNHSFTHLTLEQYEKPLERKLPKLTRNEEENKQEITEDLENVKRQITTENLVGNIPHLEPDFESELCLEIESDESELEIESESKSSLEIESDASESESCFSDTHFTCHPF